MIPWWGKIAGKLVLSRLPLGYGVWQRLGLFRHGRMDTSEYAVGIFQGHVKKAGLVGLLDGKTILELGPGDSIATAIVAAACGARAILVDAGRFVRGDLSPYMDLESGLKAIGLDPPDLGGCRSITEILRQCGAVYLTDGLGSLRSLESSSVDLSFSQAVLEHVRVTEFSDTMRELSRVMTPEGIGSHRIDLRDHLGGALNNLRFAERVWESEFFRSSGFYTNRIRYSRMLELFRDAGLNAQVIAVRCWDRPPTPRSRLAEEFRDLPDHELCISGFDVLLTRQAA